MTRTTTVIFCTLVLASTTRAQLFQPISAREYLADIETQARTVLAQDAITTNVIFASLSYMSISLEMDTATGKATGWLYRCYSANLDSILYFGAVKPVAGPVQVFALPIDTITKYLPFNVATTGLIEPWVDSPEALAGSKSGGGGTFLHTHPDARIGLAVVVNNPVANPVIPLGEYWMFVYTSSSDTLTCLVWADSGDPLRCRSSAAPVIISVPKGLARVGELYLYDVNATGQPAPDFRLVSAPAGMSIDSATGVITWIPTAQQVGLNDVTVRAINVNGEDEQAFQVQVQDATRAPKIVSVPVTEVTANDTYMYTLVATGSPAPTFRVLAPPQGMIVDSLRGILLWIPSRTHAGLHDMSIVARNDAGADTQRYQLGVIASPLFQPLSDKQAYAGWPFTVTVQADGYPPATYSVISGPAGLTVEAASGTIQWTPSLQQLGQHTIVIGGQNKAGSNQVSFTVTVTAVTSVDDSRTPERPTLIEISPQPAGRAADFTMHLGEGGRVTLKLYDLFGRCAAVLLETDAEPGSFLLHGDLSALPPGYYLCVLTSGTTVRSKPMIRK